LFSETKGKIGSLFMPFPDLTFINAYISITYVEAFLLYTINLENDFGTVGRNMKRHDL